MKRGRRLDTREMCGTATFPVQKTWDEWHCHGFRAPRITRGHRSELCVKCGRRLDTLFSLFDPVSDNMDFVASNGAQVMLRGKILSREIFSRVALRKLVELIAFGDSMNDYELIKMAGHGYAMGNARSALKQVSDRVIETNSEHAVQRELARILRQGE